MLNIFQHERKVWSKKGLKIRKIRLILLYKEKNCKKILILVSNILYFIKSPIFGQNLKKTVFWRYFGQIWVKFHTSKSISRYFYTRNPNLLFILFENASLKNRQKSDKDLVTTRDPPVKFDIEFVILVVELLIIGYWFFNTSCSSLMVVKGLKSV